MAMPPDGASVLVPSLVAGFAKLVRYRCNELGAFADDGERADAGRRRVDGQERAEGRSGRHAELDG